MSEVISSDVGKRLMTRKEGGIKEENHPHTHMHGLYADLM